VCLCCNFSLQGKSQIVEDELRLVESMVQSAEGTRAAALELGWEFEDKFLAYKHLVRLLMNLH
jgi:hypothetical protein